MQENDKSKPIETSDQAGERVSCKFEYVVEGADGIPIVKPTAEEFSDMGAFFQEVRDLGERYGAIKVLKPESVSKPWEESSDGISTDKKIDVWVERSVRRKGEYFEIELVSDTSTQSNSKSPSTILEPPKIENNISKAIAYYWRSLTHDNLWYGYSHHNDPMIFGIPSRRSLESRVHLRSSVPENTWPTSGRTFAGKWKTTLPWRIESKKLYAVHVHLGGAPLQWYLIPSSQAAAFQKLAEKLAPDEHWRCADFLLHQNILFPPSTLAQSGINISSIVLRPNEMLITYPGSYHSAFCLGDTALRRFVFYAHDSLTSYEDIWSLGIVESAFSSKSNWPHVHKPKKASCQDVSHADPQETTEKGSLPLYNPFKQDDLQSNKTPKWNGVRETIHNDRKLDSTAINSISSSSSSPSPVTDNDTNSTSLPLFTLWNSKFRSEFIKKSQEMTNSNVEFSQFESVYLHASNHPLFPPPILGLPVPAQFARGDVFWGRILEDRASERMLLLECGSSDTIEVPYECILTSSSAAGRRSPSYYNPPLKIPNIIYDDGFPVNWNDFDELPSLDRFVLPELLPGNPIRFIPSTKPALDQSTNSESSKVNGTKLSNESVPSDMATRSPSKPDGIVDGNVPTSEPAMHEGTPVSDEIEQNTEDVSLENRSELLEVTDDLEDRLDRLEDLRRSHSQSGLEQDTQDAVSNLTRRAPEDFSVSLETYELCVNEELEAVNDFSLFPSLE
ncbi:Lid2 complex subunit Jmj3 [Schizosaccharomyces cryophilus OY26]|uniref:Lid2 complex subunit Jmj3 n=1 Tax=Schizosaccharomyces cryophilus (strain OY26 / ATCC MYA-4695 / CBS 11777 / NBRC 106824 / NRRL Y48691) TaxID=653667 RepID=S9X5Y1_SCHCR|nr:Lid2 complex subunit Jmj3 [Schizosaccharomyces cryophilus OY26]EPY49201.1 Lid2 complex subunit Jmj3 [Schizosaccharomyces cryophilus OY26]